jgi:small subunit ribosomal protein S2
MAKTQYKELLDAGVHFGHLKRKWHPKMAPYIFMEKNGIHIIDLNKTAAKLDEAGAAMEQIAKSGKKILFVATKKQAKAVVEKHVKPTGMPYVTERWPGGMLTNFATIRKAVRKMSQIDNMMKDGTFDVLSKRERLQITRQRAKLERDLGSISDLNRLPSALFVVDIKKEHIAVAEAKKLNIPTFAIVDTNSNPTKVDFPIPANDDAANSIDKLLSIICKSVTQGLEERNAEKEKNKAKPKAEKKAEKVETTSAKAEEKPKKAESAAKPEKAEKTEKAEKSEKTEKPAKAEKAEKTEAAKEESK